MLKGKNNFHSKKKNHFYVKGKNLFSPKRKNIFLLVYNFPNRKEMILFGMKTIKETNELNFIVDQIHIREICIQSFWIVELCASCVFVSCCAHHIYCTRHLPKLRSHLRLRGDFQDIDFFFIFRRVIKCRHALSLLHVQIRFSILIFVLLYVRNFFF